MSTKKPGKNPNQRVHYVLAENYTKAKPLLERLRINGIDPRNRAYLYEVHQLDGVTGERCAFIFGPGYGRNPAWRQLSGKVLVLLHEGAIKKADPEAAFQKREKEREEARKKEEAAAAPAPSYKQYLLGGPSHARRIGGPPVPREGFTVRVGDDGVHYRSYQAEILGQPMIFWIHEGSWNDRQRLVRDFVLMPLEV